MKQLLLTLGALWSGTTHPETPSAQYLQLLPHILATDVLAVQSILSTTTLTLDDRAQLTTVAHEVKRVVQHKITALNGKKMRWGLLGKGLAYSGATIYCLTNAALTVWSGIKTRTRDASASLFDAESNTIVKPSYMDKLENDGTIPNTIAMLIHPPLMVYGDAYEGCRQDSRKLLTMIIPTTLTLACLWAAYVTTTASIAHFKAGWNYQAVLEKKIDNLDAIIAALETNSIQETA